MADNERPCRSYVLSNGRKVYCDRGAEGHWGTCCGSRDEDTYRALLAASKAKP